MNCQITITTTETAITVRGPYCEYANQQYKSIGGRFTNGEWTLPGTQAGQAVIRSLFGLSEDLVTVSVKLDSEVTQATDGQFRVGGYVLANRRGRDYAVQLPDGVQLVSGSFCRSGGSVKSPRVTWNGESPTVNVVMRRDKAEELGLVKPEADLVEITLDGVNHRLTIEQAKALLVQLTAKLS